MRGFSWITGVLTTAVVSLGVASVASAASPSVTTGGASSITKTSAVLGAAINPGGQNAVYYFQYGPTKAYGAESVKKGAGAGTKSVNVKTGISKLTPFTTYHYRVVASNAQGTTVGKDRSFKTKGPPLAPPGVFTGGTLQRTLNSAMLTGVIASPKSPATYRFQFGLTPAYGTESAPFTLPAQPFPQPVSFALTGLAPHTIYHYRLAASNKDGLTVGLDQLFITGRVKARGLTRHARKRHLNGRRYSIVTSGRLSIPKGFPGPQSCDGTVRVRIKVGSRTRRSLLVAVGPDCRYSASTVLSAARRGSTLHITALFRGNALLLPKSAMSQTLHIG